MDAKCFVMPRFYAIKAMSCTVLIDTPSGPGRDACNVHSDNMSKGSIQMVDKLEAKAKRSRWALGLIFSTRLTCCKNYVSTLTKALIDIHGIQSPKVSYSRGSKPICDNFRLREPNSEPLNPTIPPPTQSCSDLADLLSRILFSLPRWGLIVHKTTKKGSPLETHWRPRLSYRLHKRFSWHYQKA